MSRHRPILRTSMEYARWVLLPYGSLKRRLEVTQGGGGGGGGDSVPPRSEKKKKSFLERPYLVLT